MFIPCNKNGQPPVGAVTFKFVNLKHQLREESGHAVPGPPVVPNPSLTPGFFSGAEAASRNSNSLASTLNINYTHRNFWSGKFSLHLPPYY